MAYKAPIWEDGKSPAISAENLNNLSQAAEGAQVLYGNSAPTSSTEGAVGQFYLVVVADSDGNYPLYQCVAIANGSYTWRDTRRIPNSITSMLGIPAPGTINRALNVLANVGNLHVWKRVQTYAEGVPAIYSIKLNDPENDVYTGGSDRTSTLKMNVSSSVHADGLSVVMDDPVKTSFTLSAGGALPDAISGKYIDFRSDSYTTNYEYVYYIPPDATITYNNYMLKLNGIQRVTAYKVSDTIPAGTTTDYLTSTDRNAYPDQSAEGGQDAYYTLGEVVTGENPSNVLVYRNNTSVNLQYSTSISVSDDGQTISLVSPENGSSGGSFAGPPSFLIGKFFKITSVSGNGGTGFAIDTVFYVPNNATINSGSYLGYTAWYVDYQPVTGYAAIPANTTITYLGQLGGGARIEVCSYVGTGTYGSDNPCSVTADFPIKVLLVVGLSMQATYNFAMVASKLTESYAKDKGFIVNQNSDYGNYGKKSSDGKTFYWYNAKMASAGLNESGVTYTFIAIG